MDIDESRREEIGVSNDEGVKQFLEEETKKLEKPITFICLGPTQVGKSTFLNKVFGRTVSEEGKTGSSCTTKPILINESKIYFLDTPGFFDTSGKEVDVKNKKVIQDYILHEVPTMDICILVFSKLENQNDGVMTEVFQWVKNVKLLLENQGKNVHLAFILTFACNVTLRTFPSAWLNSQKFSQNKERRKAAWEKWKKERIDFARNQLDIDLSRNFVVICTDFSEEDEEGNKLKNFYLPDGSLVMEEISEGMKQLCDIALYLMSKNSPNDMGKQKANEKLGMLIQDAAKRAGISATIYGIINGIAVATTFAGEATTTGATVVAAAKGLAIGFGAGLTGSSIIFIPIAFAGAYIIWAIKK